MDHDDSVDAGGRSALADAFDHPPAAARPSPLFWWSGTDVTRERLSWHLDAVATAGIGCTIVGYSHTLEALPDAGLPTPLSPPWWELMRWYVDSSATRGLTVGFQDYNFVTEALRRVGTRTTDRHGGTLTHRDWAVTGPCTWSGEVEGTLVDLVLLDEQGSAPRAIDHHDHTDPVNDRRTITCEVPAGTWQVCAVSRTPGVLRGEASTFDPLHPRAGAEHIAEYYDLFAANLGAQLGRGFTTFFQDELDLGVRTPMVNDDVLEALAEAGFRGPPWLHALWHDVGPGTARFREVYHQLVVQRLEENYFRPIFDWHEQHGTVLCMDQLSRGDLRAGRAHYGDYCATMKWYQGPGNDDPDLRAPRALAAFKVSASIAALNDRPFVMDEAFHSSSWNVTPAAIRAGLDQAFAAGASQIALHGLYLTTEGGWWEWAAPDFHHRQPWFDQSDQLWAYVTRLSALLRTGRQVCDVAVLDPTEDLDLCGEDTASPELALAALSHLAKNTIDAHLLDRRSLLDATATTEGLVVGGHTYRVLVVPGMAAVRADTRAALDRHLAAGGALVVVTGDSSGRPADAHRPPAGTVELKPAELEQLAPTVRSLGATDIRCDDDAGLLAIHRAVPGADAWFVANPHHHPVSTRLHLRGRGDVEQWDAYTGTKRRLPSAASGAHTTVSVDLDASGSVLLVLVPAPAATRAEPISVRPPVEPPVTTSLGPWIARPHATLDNRFQDVVAHDDLPGARPEDPVPVATWFVQSRSAGARAVPTWDTALVGDAQQFWVVGPVAAHDRDAVERVLTTLTDVDPSIEVVPGLRWQPYAFSPSTGLIDDPLLRDRSSGPHGLRSVSAEFLVAEVFGPVTEPGSSFYFWTSVVADTARVTVTMGARVPLSVWLAGDPVPGAPQGEPNVTYAPWDLLEISVRSQHTDVTVAPGRVPLLVRLECVERQPGRAHVVVHRTADRPTRSAPAQRDRMHLPWWRGERPALRFDPRPGMRDERVLRVTLPPGATRAVVRAWGTLTSASVGATAAGVGVLADTAGTRPGQFWIDLPPTTAGELLELVFAAGPSWANGAGVLDGPVVWITDEGAVHDTRWTEIGLSDFSGGVTFRTTVRGRLDDERVAVLTLRGLVGSAAVRVDGVEVARLIEVDSVVDLSAALGPGAHDLELDTRNTAANVHSRLPTPFVSRAEVGGGFDSASIGYR